MATAEVQTQREMEEYPCCMPMPDAHVPDLPPSNLRPAETLDSGTPVLSLAVSRDYYWKNGTVLHVRFLDRNPVLEAMVEEAAAIWSDYADIKFVFDNLADAVIRIAFVKGLAGGSSQLGKKDHMVLSDKPTMRLGADLLPENFRRTALHEFGHVLGCIHEHSSPSAHLNWQKDVVYAYYAKESKDRDTKWDKAWVDANVFNAYTETEVQATAFDSKSIMIYPILPGWAPPVIADWPKKLSASDKFLINRMYPPVLSTERVTYHTSESSKGWVEPNRVSVKKVVINNPRQCEFDLAVGLTHFDLESKGTSMGLRAFSKDWDDTTYKSFDLQLESTEGTVMNSAGATCMVTQKYEHQMKVGIYKTREEDLQSEGPEDKLYRSRVTFDPAFDEAPPGVIVWLRAFDFKTGYPYAVSATAEKVDAKGFDVCVEASQGARLISAEVAWIAHDSDRPNLKSGRNSFGRFVKNKGDTAEAPEKHCIKEHPLGIWQVSRLYAGVSKIHFDHNYNMRLGIETQLENSKDGASFKIDAKIWGDTKCIGVDVSHLAICL